MNRRLCLACLVPAVLVLAVGTAGAVQLYGIEGPPSLGTDYYLGTVKGEVRLTKIGGGREDWELTRTDKGTLIRLSEGAEKRRGWYLSYDPEGKSKEVILAPQPGPGSYW